MRSIRISTYFLDITDEYLPKNLNDNLILTEKQRKEIGITTKEEKREIERYRFFQAIFSGKDCVIFTKKDEEKGVEISPIFGGDNIEILPTSF